MQSPIQAVKERPTLFSGAMVRAILEGRKTQTRRIVKPQPPAQARLHGFYGENAPRKQLKHTFGWFVPEAGDLWPCNDEDRIRCPYGQPGDLLWVREAWRVPKDQDTRDAATMARLARQAGYDTPWVPTQFDADGKRLNWDDVEIWGREVGRYRHARFMPRWASRILLEIVSVRVERLQDISDEDAKAEGVSADNIDITSMNDAEPRFMEGHVAPFLELWESINGPESLKANPFVWCVEFKRVRPA